MYKRIACASLLLMMTISMAFAAGNQEPQESEQQQYGDLLPQFADTDGNLVADPPQDEADLKDPSTLIFSYTPVEDPEVYRGVWEEFLVHLEAVTGKDVQFFAVQNYAAQLEALRSGRLHIAGVNTGSVPMAVNTAGLVPFAIMAGTDGSYGYEMEIITQPDSDIREIEDLEGRQLALVSPTSNSGFKAPTAILSGEFGMEVDEDYNTAFSGNHDASILGVANGDYEAAAIANSVLKRMIERGALAADDVRTIYKSQTFPTTAYGYVHDLHPELAEKITEAFYSFDWTGTSLEEEFGGGNNESQFMPITYQEHWAVIRTIDKANGVEYR